MFANQAQAALNASQSLGIGVYNHQILTNPNSLPVYNGMRLTSEVTFPLSSFTAGATIPSYSLASGNAVMGFLTAGAPASKGFLEFMAKGSGGTGAYVNVYKVDKSTATMTNVYASADIGSSVPNGSWGWVSLNLSPTVSVNTGDLLCLEIVNTGMTSTFLVAAEQLGIPNGARVPANMCANRVLASSGGTSPATVAPGSLTYSAANIPFVSIGVSAVPPAYNPPNQTSWTQGGLYSYSIPSWVATDYANGHSDLFDIVTIGGGGGGGDGASSPGFLGVGAYAYLGQGGTGGTWGGVTKTFGTDIALGTTTLYAAVGFGGVTCGDGCHTMVGYGLGTPAFDAAGTGAVVVSATTMSWTHTATAGAYVLVFVNTTAFTYHVTYGGTTMTPLAVVLNGGSGANGAQAVYGLANVSGGTSTITVTNLYSDASTISANMVGNSVSYTGVSNVASANTALASGTALSQGPLTYAAHQIVVQSFAVSTPVSMTALSGGTNRVLYYATMTSGKTTVSGDVLCISDSSTSPSTFAATAGTTVPWSSVAVVLNPTMSTVLLDTAGGHGGGPEGAKFPKYDNPANSNTTSTGLGPGNETFNSALYWGGSNSTITGNSPGGGGGGLSTAAGSAGADGGAWITVRQP